MHGNSGGVAMGSLPLIDDYDAALDRLAAMHQDSQVREAVIRARAHLRQLREAVELHEATNPVSPCLYDGPDSTAEIGNRMDNAGNVYAFSRCHCGTETLERGTPREAAQALHAHRHPTASTPEEGGQ